MIKKLRVLNMKGSKRENLLLAVLLGLTGAFLIISYYKVMAGPLRSVLESEATWTMLGEVVLVFAWNLFWLRRAYGGKRDKMCIRDRCMIWNPR